MIALCFEMPQFGLSSIALKLCRRDTCILSDAVKLSIIERLVDFAQDNLMLYRRVRWCRSASLRDAIAQDDAMLYRRMT